MQQHKIKESWGYYILIQGSTILLGELHGDVYQDPKLFMLSRDSFFHYSIKTFVSSLKLQFAAHLPGKCGDRLFTSEQGCVGSLSNLGDFEISQMPCFAKICKCPPCGQSWQIST